MIECRALHKLVQVVQQNQEGELTARRRVSSGRVASQRSYSHQAA